MNFKTLFGHDLLRSFIKKGVVTAIIAVTLPSGVAVAEPSIGSGGAIALKESASEIAKPAITRFVGRRLALEVSAYTTRKEETDDTPCIAANGENICDPAKRNTVATNDLPIGTKVIIPSISPNVLVVRDRMNARYTGKGNMDVLADTVSDARVIGRRTREVIVLD